MANQITLKEFSELVQSALCKSIHSNPFTFWEYQAMRTAAEMAKGPDNGKKQGVEISMEVLDAPVCVATTDFSQELNAAIDHAIHGTSTEADDCFIRVFCLGIQMQSAKDPTQVIPFDKSSYKRNEIYACEHLKPDNHELVELNDLHTLVGFVHEHHNELSPQLIKALFHALLAAGSYIDLRDNHCLMAVAVNLETAEQQKSNILAHPLDEREIKIAKQYIDSIKDTYPEMAGNFEKMVSMSESYRVMLLQNSSSKANSAPAVVLPSDKDGQCCDELQCCNCTQGEQITVTGGMKYPFVIVKCPFESQKNKYFTADSCCTHLPELIEFEDTEKAIERKENP